MAGAGIAISKTGFPMAGFGFPMCDTWYPTCNVGKVAEFNFSFKFRMEPDEQGRFGFNVQVINIFRQ